VGVRVLMKNKIAELCGATMGDGWICSSEKSFFLAGDPTEDKDYYDKHISRLVKDILNIDIVPKSFPYWKVYGVGIYKKENIKKLLSYGLKKGKKVDKVFIPEWILGEGESCFFSFLRGFFDTDGSIFCQRDYTKYASKHDSKYHVNIRIRIGSISPLIIDQIYDQLQKFNLKCTKRRLHKGFKNNRNNHDVYILEVNNSKWVKDFFDRVKPANPKHQTKYKVWKKFGFCPPKTTLIQRKEIIKNKLSPYKFY
jgi:hypothetical protein